MTELEVQVLNAAGSVEAVYSLAELEVMDYYIIPTSIRAAGERVLLRKGGRILYAGHVRGVGLVVVRPAACLPDPCALPATCVCEWLACSLRAQAAGAWLSRCRRYAWRCWLQRR